MAYWQEYQDQGRSEAVFKISGLDIWADEQIKSMWQLDRTLQDPPCQFPDRTGRNMQALPSICPDSY